MTHIIGSILCIIILLPSYSCLDRCVGTEEGIVPNHHQPTKIQRDRGSTPNLSAGKDRDYASGEILVRFRKGTGKNAIEAVQKKLRLKTIRIISKPSLYLMKITDGSSVEKTMEHLKNFEEVRYSEPNYVMSIN